MKLHKNDRSNKSSLLLLKFCHLRLSALALGYIHVQNHEKIYVKSEFKAVLLKPTANVQSDNSVLRCSKFTPFGLSVPHLDYLPLPLMYKKWFLASHFFTVWSIMMKLHKNDRSSKSFLLLLKFCHLRLSALALRLYTCTKS